MPSKVREIIRKMSKMEYTELSAQQATIPLFSQPWWLDAACGSDNWNVSIVKRDKKVVGALPYVCAKKWGFKLSHMPSLTPYLGPWIDYPAGQKYATRLSYEMGVMEEMLSNLPDFHSFDQGFHYNVTNWLPFYWNGFQATTRYSYVLDDVKDQEATFSRFEGRTRTDIRKAEKELRVFSSEDLNAFWKLGKKTFSRQQMEVPYGFDLVERIDRASQARQLRKILFAQDGSGQLHGAIYLVWDSQKIYYLMGGSEPRLRNSGALALLLWEGIRLAGSMGLAFDFEGSMIRSIEQFVRGFGGRQSPYFRVTKLNSSTYAVLRKLNQVSKSLWH